MDHRQGHRGGRGRCSCPSGARRRERRQWQTPPEATPDASGGQIAYGPVPAGQGASPDGSKDPDDAERGSGSAARASGAFFA